MADNSTALIDARRIFKVVRQKAYSATLATLEKAAQDMLARFAQERKFFSITGNALTSFSVGIYYKGSIVSIFNLGATAEQPTRVTLRKGEIYDKEEYYDGPITEDEETGQRVIYRGKYGKGGQWGPSIGPWYLRRQHFPKRQTWKMVVVLPVSYAGYNDKITRTMQRIMMEMPQIIDYNIVRIENTPSQSEIASFLKSDTMKDMGMATLDSPF